MIPHEIGAAVRQAVAEGELSVAVPASVPVKVRPTGELSSPVALRIAGAACRPAHEVAAVIARHLARRPGVRGVRVTGPGFLTIEVDVPGGPIPETRAALLAAWPVRPLTFANPGFRVRFAYTRASAVRRHAADLGILASRGPAEEPLERRLTGLLAGVPDRVREAARRGEARPLARHLVSVADAYHDVHELCPAMPKGDEPVTDRHAARLGLAEAARAAIGAGLRMLGEVPNDRL